MYIFKSKRPGLSNAWSTKPILFVAPIKNILLFWVNPSISVNSWLIVDLCYFVCQFYVLDPMASISSIKIIAPFSIFLAFSNIYLILFGPTPTKIYSNSEAEALKNSRPASLAINRASIVFPVPGGPWSKTPLLILSPKLVNCSGDLIY